MFFLLSNILSALSIFGLSFLKFNDAEQAFREGVFSATSVIGYSIGKSVFLYVAYVLLAVVCGGLYWYWHRANWENYIPTETALPTKPIFKKSELVLLGSIMIAFVVGNYYFAEDFFNQNTLYSEEFYNLAAVNEMSSDKFDLAYPYSIGNLVSIRAFQKVGLTLVDYKVLINVAALGLLYFCIASFVTSRGRRWAYFLFFLVFYFQPLISPSLHRNLLRFIIPFAVLTVLQLIQRTGKNNKSTYLYLSLLSVAIFWFSSADILVVSYVVYALFAGIVVATERSLKNVWPYLAAPITALLFLSIFFGTNEFYFLKNQVLSILLYSGFANTTPYYNVWTTFQWAGLAALLKNILNLIIYFSPFLILFNLWLFFVAYYKKIQISLSSRLTYVMILTPAYFVYHRQTLGDAGIGRIGIAAVVLMCITFLLREITNRPRQLEWAYRLSLVFLGAIFFVSGYFLRYSLIDLYHNHIKPAQPLGIVSCADTIFAQSLHMAGFERCDKSFVEQLQQLKKVVGDRVCYVFDDTFALYYMLNSRPITLIPTYSMPRTRQLDILKKMDKFQVSCIIYPKLSHFFGVPDAYVNDPKFMSLIKEYDKAHLPKREETDLYIIKSKE